VNIVGFKDHPQFVQLKLNLTLICSCYWTKILSKTIANGRSVYINWLFWNLLNFYFA